MNKLLSDFLSRNKFQYSYLRKQHLLFQALLFFLLSSKAQVVNFVNNGSFEDCVNCTVQPYVALPKYWSAIDSASYSFMYCDVNPPISNLPGIGNGYQLPRSGSKIIISSVYCYTNSCNYIQSRGYPRNRLKQKLIPNKTYCVKFYINNRNNNTVAVDAFAAYFSNEDLDTITYCSLPLTYLNPQIQNPNGNIITDTLGWVAITGTFVANGTEKYMVLGNFKSNAAMTNTAIIDPTFLPQLGTDIFYDDVSCIELDLPAFAGRDTNFIPGNSIFLGRQPDVGIDEACIWYKLPNPTPIDTIAGFWVTPTATSTYVVRQEICGLVKWDTVVLYMDAVGLERLKLLDAEFKLSPNPATDFLEIGFDKKALETGAMRLYIIDLLGRVIREEELTLKENRGHCNTENLPSGAYLLRLTTSEGPIIKKFLVSR